MGVPSTQRVRTADEIAAVATLAHEIWNQHFPPLIGQLKTDYMVDKFQSAPAIARQIRDDGYEYYLVADGNERVGYFALVPDADRGSMQLSKIYLKLESRGRGLGLGLLSFVEQECASRGIRDLWLSVNKGNADSIGFYKRAGFAVVGATVTDIGNGFEMDDYRMAKTVARHWHRAPP
ncbi:MAG: GNAT family N-acetyltransferase [Polyangiales bacterium]